MNNFAFPATRLPETKDGGFVVTFVDLPEAITQGETPKAKALDGKNTPKAKAFEV